MTEDKTEALKENARDVLGDYSSLSIGGVLRKTRLQYGLTLEQVHQATRIKHIYLEALEDEDFERLPGAVYVTGFVRSYADYLGLDSEQMLLLLKKKTGPKPVRPVYNFPVANDEQKIPGKKVVIGSTIALIIILSALAVGKSGYKTDEIPAVPEELVNQMAVPEKPAEEDAPEASAPIPAEKPKPHPVVMKAIEDVWLEIRDGGGKPVFSRVLKTGEEYWVPADENSYAMTTGNAGGLQMVVEGVVMSPMGKTGEVRRNVALNPAALKVMLNPLERSSAETPVRNQ